MQNNARETRQHVAEKKTRRAVKKKEEKHCTRTGAPSSKIGGERLKHIRMRKTPTGRRSGKHP